MKSMQTSGGTVLSTNWDEVNIAHPCLFFIIIFRAFRPVVISTVQAGSGGFQYLAGQVGSGHEALGIPRAGSP